MDKISIKSLNLDELELFVKESSEPSFRTKQLLEWIYNKNIDDFNLMTNLPKSFINKITRNFVIEKTNAINIQKSTDGTTKYVLKFSTKTKNFSESICVETVAIPSLKDNSNRLTLCISSQAGCPMGCKFCATGKQGLTRNLCMGEIIEQVIFVSKYLETKPTNIVVMGQGEPFLNFKNVICALEILNDAKFFNIGARKITLSTCGIISGINSFSKIKKQYGLAISLHSAIQHKRDAIMPGVKKYSLRDLKDSVLGYIEQTNRRVTFEYLMLRNFNDTEEDLKAVKIFCSGLLCHINLIKLNKIESNKFIPSTNETINKWITELNNSGIETTLRDSRGSDIDAACGQLILKQK